MTYRVSFLAPELLHDVLTNLMMQFRQPFPIVFSTYGDTFHKNSKIIDYLNHMSFLLFTSHLIRKRHCQEGAQKSDEDVRYTQPGGSSP